MTDLRNRKIVFDIKVKHKNIQAVKLIDQSRRASPNLNYSQLRLVDLRITNKEIYQA